MTGPSTTTVSQAIAALHHEVSVDFVLTVIYLAFVVVLICIVGAQTAKR